LGPLLKITILASITKGFFRVEEPDSVQFEHAPGNDSTEAFISLAGRNSTMPKYSHGYFRPLHKWGLDNPRPERSLSCFPSKEQDQHGIPLRMRLDRCKNFPPATVLNPELFKQLLP
jgi:hypothetical protein